MTDDVATARFAGSDDTGLFKHFPPSNGSFSLSDAIDGPPAEGVRSGKTLPASAARPRRRKQETPKRKTTAVKLERTIKQEQQKTTFVIPRAHFRRIVKEIIQDCTPEDLSIQQAALDSLQSMSEDYLTNIFRNADGIRAINKVSTLCKMHMDYVTSRS